MVGVIRGSRFLRGVTIGLLMVASSAAASDAILEVAPGTVVRWHGVGTEGCAAFGRSWLPVAGTCWFPVDLLQPEGVATLSRTRLGDVDTVSIRVGSYPYPVQELTVDDGMVNLSEQDLARAEAEARRVAALWDRGGPRRFSLPLHPPLAKLSPAKSFGARRILNGEPRSPHTGVDYAGTAGTPVLAAASARVALAESHFFPGRSVFLDHGGGLISMYFHLDTIEVAVGDEVTRGQVIGTVGSTGRSTGPHLHFGVRWQGARIDPTILLGPVESTPAVQ